MLFQNRDVLNFEGVDLIKERNILSAKRTTKNINNLTYLIEKLHEIFQDEKVNTEEVKEAMAQYKSNPNDWKNFLKFDLFRYTRNLVDEGNGKFNLMILCWGENHASNIHDHSSADCFVKILDGQLTETIYDWPDGNKEDGVENNPNSMKVVKSIVHEKDEVTYINDSMGLHQMYNPSHTNKTVTLHLYSPPFKTCKVFDQKNGKSIDVKLLFWSKFGKDVPLNE